MKTKITMLIFLLGGVLLAPISDCRSEDTKQLYEYATARFMEDKTAIMWADGTLTPVVPEGKTFENGEKYPKGSDYRMYWLTVAMNMMAKKGYELVFMDGADVVMKRAVGK